jgi:hypothetical protein
MGELRNAHGVLVGKPLGKATGKIERDIGDYYLY